MKLERLFWFDTIFKGRAPQSDPPVKLFVMGGGDGTKTADGHLDHGGEWTSVASWPRRSPARTHSTCMAMDGSAWERPAAEAEPTHFVYDPPTRSRASAAKSIREMLSSRPAPGIRDASSDALPAAKTISRYRRDAMSSSSKHRFLKRTWR